MNYEETLAYLYARLPMFTRIGSAAFKKDLTNTLRLCEALGHPERQFRSIHIGGTNGKGSSSSMLASILQAAGHKTGLYTSPHLISFTERIRIDGMEMPPERVTEWVTRHRDLIEAVEPSFFEATVAMCFDWFAAEGVDIAVIEVGLGGRLDSTNVILPEACLITNIGYDHMDMLGDTLPLIAGEKAGIIKPGVPVVIGARHAETDAVFTEKAAQQGADIVFAEDVYRVERLRGDLHGQWLRVNGVGDYYLDLPGLYQMRNLPGVLGMVAALRARGWNIPEESVQAGLAQVRTRSGLRGRMELLRDQPQVIADTGHNAHGIAEVMPQVVASVTPGATLHMVWGMARDKDHSKVLELLPRQAQYYWVKPDLPRGLEADQLQEKAAVYGLAGQVWPSVAAGVQAALAAAAPQDLIYIGGSTFVVAEAVILFP